ncbi:hypothetical protein PVK06_036397 [Gossypium arboreum]|uniref:Uncharacterized protein n=1 Tax=Gossypium arboreum TaxID=29729 RepID=A0ABR0NLM3_GOSAR|nr:hypothetical protein PVK06_036397 [Gossypium arboreum]
MTQMMTMIREMSEALPLQEEIIHDVLKSDQDGHFILDNRLDLDNGNPKELGIGDHDDKLKITKSVSDPINVEIDITVDLVSDVKVKVTTNMELKPILNKRVEKPIHFLAIAEKVPTEEVDEFNSFSSDNGNKARATKTSRNTEGRKLEAIIPQKTIQGYSNLVLNGS